MDDDPFAVGEFGSAWIDRKIFAYFSHVASMYSDFGATRPKVVCVAHLLDSALHFLPAVAQIVDVPLVFPKPKSLQQDVLTTLESDFVFEPIDRLDPGTLSQRIIDLVGDDDRLGLLDIGGYFSSVLEPLATRLGDRFVGVVEGTENGLQKYEAFGDVSVPVVSVARSPLKYPENRYVGRGIIFSVEALLRERGEVLQGLGATVIGYGKIGRGVAEELRMRSLNTTVYDVDPVALAEAAAHGFRIASSKDAALRNARLVVCATGNKALSGWEFRLLARGAYLATVTSGDDELALDDLRVGYARTPINKHVTEFRHPDGYFYLLNEGNAVNFIHGAVLGASLQLIEGEKLAAIV